MDEIDKNKAHLTKAEKAMYNSWTDSYREIMNGMSNLINELHTMRLAELGREKGLDMDDEEWSFDHNAEEFVKKVKPEKPTETIPGKKTAIEN